MKISIIILSFNNYEETTGQCLAALAADPDFKAWEVIVVDNASDANTQQQLTEAKRLYPEVNFVFNSRNVGFAAGNNTGIKLATGDILILLNSDAFPTPGMLARLADHFAHDARLGMVGPVTNAAGNEQCIYTRAGTMEEKIREGLLYAANGGHETLSAYRLDFFCVAIPSHVFKQVGGLDEDFGRGYYEDLDYSLRVKAAGYRLGVAEDTFVYHRGSSSFGKIPGETKALLKRNKRLVIRKHGADVVFHHVRQANLAMLSQYLSRKFAGAEVPSYRISNRLQLAHSGLPRSWFKRWRYLRSISAIEKSLKSIGGASF
ncbi:MAG TPA: glycosyltransferase family 2 protein [Gallionella sp.]|nr:glycosyltransferase family 2 protein [Gallionella sp.]